MVQNRYNRLVEAAIIKILNARVYVAAKGERGCQQNESSVIGMLAHMTISQDF